MQEQPFTLRNHNPGFADCKATFNYYAKPDSNGCDSTCTISQISAEPLDAIVDRDNYLQLDCYTDVVSSL